MSVRSFRVQLALWYAGMVGVALLGFAALLGYGFGRTAERLVDRELTQRADGIRHMEPPPHMPPLRDPGAEPGADRGPMTDHGPEPGHGPGPPPEGEGFGPRPPSWNDDAERVADVWRPRFYRPDENAGQFPDARELFDTDAIEVALRDGSCLSTVNRNHQTLRVISVRMARHDQTPFVVQFARDMGDFHRLWWVQQRTLWGLLPLCLLLAAAGAFGLTSRALAPLRQVTQAASEIGAEDLTRRLPVAGHDELAELARTFNEMIARLHASFEQQRRFTADASHELRTPLTRAKAATSLALEGEPEPATYRASLEIADHAVDAMTQLIAQLLTLARSDAGELLGPPAPVDLGAVARDALAALPPAEAARVTLELPTPAVYLPGDASQLQRVVANLLSNALRHTPPDGSIRLVVAEAAGQVTVTVADTGEGIAEADLPHVTKRFYRVDAARSRRAGGTGLGLAISEGIVRAHGGELHIASRLREGTVVTVSLPSLRPGPPSG